MTVGLHGVGIGILAVLIMAGCIVIFLITGIMVLAEKNEKQIGFKELKAYRFFIANIYTAIFDLFLIYVLSKIESAVVFFDKSYLFPVAALAIYIVPFRYFLKRIKNSAG